MTDDDERFELVLPTDAADAAGRLLTEPRLPNDVADEAGRLATDVEPFDALAERLLVDAMVGLHAEVRLLFEACAFAFALAMTFFETSGMA